MIVQFELSSKVQGSVQMIVNWQGKAQFGSTIIFEGQPHLANGDDFTN